MRSGPADIQYFVSRQQECMILPLWRKGMNTLEIAKALAIPEFEVTNRLPKLREQQKGWGNVG